MNYTYPVGSGNSSGNGFGDGYGSGYGDGDGNSLGSGFRGSGGFHGSVGTITTRTRRR